MALGCRCYECQKHARLSMLDWFWTKGLRAICLKDTKIFSTVDCVYTSEMSFEVNARWKSHLETSTRNDNKQQLSVGDMTNKYTITSTKKTCLVSSWAEKKAIKRKLKLASWQKLTTLYKLTWSCLLPIKRTRKRISNETKGTNKDIR